MKYSITAFTKMGEERDRDKIDPNKRHSPSNTIVGYRLYIDGVYKETIVRETSSAEPEIKTAKNIPPWWWGWKTIRHYQGTKAYEVQLPNSHQEEKSITIKGKYTRKHIEWLFNVIDCALWELQQTYEKTHKKAIKEE